MRKVLTIAVAALLAVLSAGIVVERGRDSREARNLADALADDLASFRRRTWPRPPLGDKSVEGHGMDDYRRAILYVPGFDPATARALVRWHDDGAPLPAESREFVAEVGPGLEFLSRGTKTFSLGRRPVPGEGFDLARLNGLALAVEADSVLAHQDGNADRALLRALELVRFGSDLTRGGTALEQHTGVRFMESGVRLLAAYVAKGALPPGGRDALAIFLDSEIRRPRDADEILAGVALTWQIAFSRVLVGQAEGEFDRDGSGWGADLPEAVNPQYVSDRDFIDAWRELRSCLDTAREGLGAGQVARIALTASFADGEASPNRILADCCADLRRTLRAIFDAEGVVRERMKRLRASLDS